MLCLSTLALPMRNSALNVLDVEAANQVSVQLSQSADACGCIAEPPNLSPTLMSSPVTDSGVSDCIVAVPHHVDSLSAGPRVELVQSTHPDNHREVPLIELASPASTLTPLPSETASDDDVSDLLNTTVPHAPSSSKRPRDDTLRKSKRRRTQKAISLDAQLSPSTRSIHSARRLGGKITKQEGEVKGKDVRTQVQPRRARRQHPWTYVNLPKGLVETMWSEGDDLPSPFIPPVYEDRALLDMQEATIAYFNTRGPSEELNSAHTLRRPKRRGPTQRAAAILPGRPHTAGSISSNKFSQILRLVAGLALPNATPPTGRYHGPISKPPVWAEVSVALLLCRTCHIRDDHSPDSSHLMSALAEPSLDRNYARRCRTTEPFKLGCI